MLESFNPATGEVVGSVVVTPVSEITAIVGRAKSAQATWNHLGIQKRVARLRSAGAKLVERAPDLGTLITREMGKPIADAVREAERCGKTLDTTLDEIVAALAPDVIEDDKTRSTVYHDAYGVCAVITPWNFPLSIPHWLVIPALLAGNAVVLKPSEETPLIAQAYAEILNEFLPESVLQTVHGGDDQGRVLVQCAVNIIAFTGTREVGRWILTAAGPDLKRVILELGGNDPMIVLADADIEAAAQFAVRNSFRNAGQVCVSTERIYVDEKIGDVFEEAVVRLTKEQVCGDGTRVDVTIGPMINALQRDRVLAYIDRAVEQGARIVAGGAGHEGNFVRPTVLTGVNHEMDVMHDEVFGPVACIMRFRTTDEAVQLANDTPYGLGAVVFGTDADRAVAIARRLTAGMVGVNRRCGGATGTPWVGARQSGFGYHSGREGHRQFTQARVISIMK